MDGYGVFPGGPVAKTYIPVQGVWFESLPGAKIKHALGQKKKKNKNKKQKAISKTTNSTKTLKMAPTSES